MISSGFIVCLVCYSPDLRPRISRNTHSQEIHSFCLHRKRMIGGFDEIAKGRAQLAAVDRVAEGVGMWGAEVAGLQQRGL